MKSGTTSEVAPGVVIFGIVTLRTGSRPVDWSFNSPHVGPYISVEGERAETTMMEIASEIGDPGLARLVHPVESITMSTTVRISSPSTSRCCSRSNDSKRSSIACGWNMDRGADRFGT